MTQNYFIKQKRMSVGKIVLLLCMLDLMHYCIIQLSFFVFWSCGTRVLYNTLFHQVVKLAVFYKFFYWSFVIVIFNPQWKCVGLVYTNRSSMHYLQASIFQFQTFKIVDCTKTYREASQYDVSQNNKQVNPFRKKYEWNKNAVN